MKGARLTVFLPREIVPPEPPPFNVDIRLHSGAKRDPAKLASQPSYPRAVLLDRLLYRTALLCNHYAGFRFGAGA